MVLSTFNLEGKVALVTGCNTGLGQGMALGLAQAGCDIVGVNRDGPDDTQSKVEALGRRFWPVQADLMQTSVVASVVEQALAAAGKIDILVNNAGIIRREDALNFSEQDWDDVMNLNSKSLFFLSQQVARQFIAQGNGGKIINIASMLSFQGGVTVPGYAASKGGIAQLTKALANEWAPFGVNVNAVAPGYIATDNTRVLREDETRSRQILERIPAGRWGEPEDVAGAFVFLSSRASDYVHGIVLPVDGGWLAR